MIHNQGSLLCTLQQVLSDQVCVKPDEELLERFCVANADISYNRVLLGKLVLQKALNGKCVQVDVNYLASVLFNDEKVRFSEYTIEEQHTSVLLLLLCAQKTGDSKYLELLQWALPYCLQYLDTFYSATLCTALESESQYEAALVEEIKKFIYYPGDEAFLVQGSEKFNEFLAHLSLNKKLDFLAEALADWYDAEKPKSDVVAVAMRFNIELLRNTYANEFNSEELTSELLKEFYNETGDGQFCLGVLVSLFSNCKVESEVKPWLDTLAEGPVFRLFIDLVTHSNFSSTFRTKLINHFLRDGATIASLHIATHLDSILTAKQRARLNRLHNEHNQPQPDIKDDNVYERKQPEPIHKVKDQ